MKESNSLNEIDVVRLKCKVSGYKFSDGGDVVVPAGTERTIIIDFGNEAEVEFFNEYDECIHFDTNKNNLELIWKYDGNHQE